MYDAVDAHNRGESNHTDSRTRWRWSSQFVLIVGAVALIAVEPASAQTATPNGTSVGTNFCQTNMADTIRNLFTLIQFGGPLICSLVAVGATVAIPLFRRADKKKDMKSMRAQAIVWGIIATPLATTGVRYLLSSVVVGGSSCTL